MNKLKTEFKGILLAIIVSAIIFGIFLAYMQFIGIPKTQARNHYNLATLEIERGNKKKAIEHLNKALTYWEEDYIKEKRDELTSQE